MPDLKDKIRQLIAADNLDAAIDLIIENTKDYEKLDEIIIQRARFNKVKKESVDGTASNTEVNTELNSLRRNILSLIRNDKLFLIQSAEITEPLIDDFKESIAKAITLSKVMEILISHYDLGKAITIREVMKLSELKSRKLVVDFLYEMEKHHLILKKKVEKKTKWILSKEGKELLDRMSGK